MTRDHDMLPPVADHDEPVNFTRCPYCQAVFRVRQAKLAVRQGEVRCGACREVFNATRHFVIQDLSGRFVPREDDAVEWGREVTADSALEDRASEPAGDPEAGWNRQPEPTVSFDQEDDAGEAEDASDTAREPTADSWEQQETVAEAADSSPRPGYGMEFFPAPGTLSRGAERATAAPDRAADAADDEDGTPDRPETDSEEPVHREPVRWEPAAMEESADSSTGTDDAPATSEHEQSESEPPEADVATREMADSATELRRFGPEQVEQFTPPRDRSIPPVDPVDTEEERLDQDSAHTVSMQEHPDPSAASPGTGEEIVESEVESTRDEWTAPAIVLAGTGAGTGSGQTEADADEESVAAVDKHAGQGEESSAPMDTGEDQDPEAPSQPETTDGPAEVRHWSLEDPEAVNHDADPVIDAPRASGQGKWFHIDPDTRVEKNPFRSMSDPLDEPSRNVDGSGAINMNGVDDYIVDRPNPLATFFWFVIALGFVFLLGLQVRTYFVDRYAQDERFRPYLSLFCRVAACELPVRRDTYRFAITHTRIDLHPDEPGALRITVKLVNQAPFPQPYPDLQLTLTDRVGRVVGRRTFPADFYLPERKENLLESGELGTVEFDLASPHEMAVGFVVDIVREPAA